MGHSGASIRCPATLDSSAREDGADKDMLRRGTHQPPKDVMELYTTVEWKKLCEEVGKLRVTLPDGAPQKEAAPVQPVENLGAPLGAVDDEVEQHQVVELWRRGESNPEE